VNTLTRSKFIARVGRGAAIVSLSDWGVVTAEYAPVPVGGLPLDKRQSSGALILGYKGTEVNGGERGL